MPAVAVLVQPKGPYRNRVAGQELTSLKSATIGR